MNLYSISSGNGGLIGVTHSQKHYVVSFRQERTAQRVKKAVHIQPRLYLERSIIEDVAHDVNTALKSIGIHSDVPNIMVDTAAKLTILKDTDANDQYHHGSPEASPFDIITVPYESFFMYPFENNLGIILQYDLFLEDSEKYVFLCNVVDPCGLYLKS
jgi:hypothetical protein